MLCSQFSLWWMICIFQQAAFAWFFLFRRTNVCWNYELFKVSCLEKVLFLDKGGGGVRPESDKQTSSEQSGRLWRVEMWNCYVTFETTDCSPLTCRSQRLTAESRFLSTQTTDNIRPFYSTACRKQGHRGLEHERPDSALTGRQHQHLVVTFCHKSHALIERSLSICIYTVHLLIYCVKVQFWDNPHFPCAI